MRRTIASGQGRKAASRPRFSEQGIGSRAVGIDLAAMCFDPRNFHLKQTNSLGQFVLRIGAEVLCGELARGVALRARTINVFHCLPSSPVTVLAVNKT